MKRFLLAAAAAICICACSPKAPKAGHVIFVGIDGMASWCVEAALSGEGFDTLAPPQLPNLRSIMEQGAYTFRKRSVMPSASAINWASIFMGVPTEMHGYNQWNSTKPAITAAETGVNGMPTTVFTALRAARPEAVSAALYNWDGIGCVIDTCAISSYEYFNPHFDGYSSEAYTAKAIDYLTGVRPDFYVLYYDELDAAGHTFGWGSPQYYETLEKMDACLGQLIGALKDAGLWDDTVLVVSSDHGGTSRGHGGFTIRELEAPYMLCGKGIKALGNMSATAPAAAPAASPAPAPYTMMQYDVAADLATLLGVPVPAHWRGRPTPAL